VSYPQLKHRSWDKYLTAKNSVCGFGYKEVAGKIEKQDAANAFYTTIFQSFNHLRDLQVAAVPPAFFARLHEGQVYVLQHEIHNKQDSSLCMNPGRQYSHNRFPVDRDNLLQCK